MPYYRYSLKFTFFKEIVVEFFLFGRKIKFLVQTNSFIFDLVPIKQFVGMKKLYKLFACKFNRYGKYNNITCFDRFYKYKLKTN